MRTIGVRLLAETSQYVRGMREAGKTTRDFGGEVDQANKRGKLDQITKATAGLGLGLLGVAGAAVKLASDFDKQMSAVKAATHAGTAEIGKLRQAALDAGAASQFSATEAAQGIEELSKAGVATADILNGGLKGALDLAAAGGLDVAEAAETAATALVQFKLQGSDVPHVADLLAAAAGKAQGSVHDMGFALKMSGLVASQFGLSVEDTTGTLASFASAGLVGSDAGTSFKQMLLQLANPAGKSRDLMEELGIAAYDTAGNFVGITNLAGQLQTKLGGLTQQQRDSALATIFGSDAIRSANVLYQQGTTGIQGWIDKTDDAGYAAETAALKTDNLAGDLERLRGSLETLAIESGSGANTGLRTLTKAANGAVDAFAGLPGPLQTTITIIAGLSGAGLLGAAGLMKVRNVAHDALTQLAEMGPAGTQAANGLGKVGRAVGKAGLWGAGLFAAYEGVKLFVGFLNSDVEPAKRDVDAMTDSLKQLADTGRVTGELAKAFGNNWSQLGPKLDAIDKANRDLPKGLRNTGSALGQLGKGMSDAGAEAAGLNDATRKMSEQSTADLKAVDAALTQLVGAGGVTQAKVAFEDLAQRWTATGRPLAALIALMPGYANAVKGAAAANVGLAKGFGTADANVRTLAGSLDAAIEAGQTLTDVWSQLNGALLNSDQAALKALTALDAVKTSFKDNGTAIEGNTKAALANRIAIGEAAKAAADAAQAKYEETGSVSAASATYQGYIVMLRQTLMAVFHNKQRVEELIGAYGRMPASVTTNVTAPGAASVKRQMKDLQTQIGKVERKLGITASVDQKSLRDAQSRLNGLLIMQEALKKGVPIHIIAAQHKNERQSGAYATGGWTGPGDTLQPAGVVHADEYVIKKSARRRIEQTNPGLLDEMNATGQLPEPGYATGGRVPVWVTARMTRVPSKKEAAGAVTPAFGSFGGWPSSPSAQRGDSGVWHRIQALVNASGIPHHFGNSYRPGDPKWHGSGRAIDWMGFNQDRLAQFFLAHQSSILEMIHRSNTRDYAYTRGRNKGSFNQSLMQAHRNHLHIAMADGGVVGEPVVGVGASGRSYSFGERGSETVTPGLPQTGPPVLIMQTPTPTTGGVSTQGLAQAVRAAMSGVTVTLDGQAVGRVQARTADRYTRGG
jgi:TP901 family phage tail tape measure protein